MEWYVLGKLAWNRQICVARKRHALFTKLSSRKTNILNVSKLSRLCLFYHNKRRLNVDVRSNLVWPTRAQFCNGLCLAGCCCVFSHMMFLEAVNANLASALLTRPAVIARRAACVCGAWSPWTESGFAYSSSGVYLLSVCNSDSTHPRQYTRAFRTVL